MSKFAVPFNFFIGNLSIYIVYKLYFSISIGFLKGKQSKLSFDSSDTNDLITYNAATLSKTLFYNRFSI